MLPPLPMDFNLVISQVTLAHQQAAKPEHDLFEPWARVHERAGAEEAGDPQGNVPEHNHERRRQGPAELMAQRAVDDEEVLHADRGQKRQAQR